MSGYVRWEDIRAEYVQRAGGDEAVEAGKQELLAAQIGHGKVSGQDVHIELAVSPSKPG
jgi:hypothetical protein